MEETEKGNTALISGIFLEFGGFFCSHTGDLD